jgi:tRNA-dihydrouridine synthase B
MGANLVYTPMLSSNAIIHNSLKTLKIASFLDKEQPVIVQIFGYDGLLISKAANIVEQEIKPAGIDINMGCPAPKITGNECGSALLRDYDKALNLANEVRQRFNGQLSIKLRLGWVKPDVLKFVRELEKIGIDSLSIHGRTAKQGYNGLADWDKIDKIARSVSIPVLGNGDITTWQMVQGKLSGSSLAGVMIGRGALGNPWLFKEIKEKKTLTINNDDLIKTIKLQTMNYIDFTDEDIAVREMRKHLGWYIKGFPGAADLRKDAMQVSSIKDIDIILDRLRLLDLGSILR